MEETEDDLRKNMASFGYDLNEMEESGKLAIDNIRLDQTLLYKSGKFDLTPLFLRIEEAVKKVGATRIAIDTFDQIFSEIKDRDVFRQELVRLIHWLKEKKLTTIFTSEKPVVVNPKAGINEFITDCVINLSHSQLESVYTRRLHILKYRGSSHGTNEYPFLINYKGISLLPITSIEVHHVSDEIISTGVGGLDETINKKGIYVGSNHTDFRNIWCRKNKPGYIGLHGGNETEQTCPVFYARRVEPPIDTQHEIPGLRFGKFRKKRIVENYYFATNSTGN